MGVKIVESGSLCFDEGAGKLDLSMYLRERFLRNLNLKRKRRKKLPGVKIVAGVSLYFEEDASKPDRFVDVCIVSCWSPYLHGKFEDVLIEIKFSQDGAKEACKLLHFKVGESSIDTF